jgi:hypothetical protein
MFYLKKYKVDILVVFFIVLVYLCKNLNKNLKNKLLKIYIKKYLNLLTKQ